MIAALVALFVIGVLLFVFAAVAIGLAIAAVAIAMKLLPFILVAWLVMRLVRSSGRSSYSTVHARHPPHNFPRPTTTGGISVEDAAWLDSRV
ncbi:MAG TPA: hypothetical protein VFE05_02300 [Longimicrobiaceae bacterium]|jgi:hypothetical protein|nr:hypothetical protein [Longimicrobiaceae bacterium]